jgi:hypothetical protein
MQEFLNPKAMLTPGVAGGMVMFLVNGLSVPFPELPPRYAALAISCVIAAIVVSADKLGWIQRGLYWVVNSLVIFVMGFGAASLGYEATAASASRGAGGYAVAAQRVETPSLVASAHAADDLKAAKPVGPAQPSAAEAEKLRLEVERLRLENERLIKAKEGAAKPPPQQQPGFFRKW